MAKGNTKYLKFKGRIAWAKIYSTDDYMGKEFWKINFYPTDEVLAKMKASGMQFKDIKEDDGSKSGVQGKFVVLRRDTEKKFQTGLQKFAPPSVYPKKGIKPLISYKEDGDGGFERVGEPILIGNGSEVEVTVAVFPAGSFGKGKRLESIRLLDLIEYNPDAEDKDEEVVEEQNAEKVDTKTSFSKKLDDDIPF